MANKQSWRSPPHVICSSGNQGTLYSFWTNMKGLWLARSRDKSETWKIWQLLRTDDISYFSYLAPAAGRSNAPERAADELEKEIHLLLRLQVRMAGLLVLQ
jgi:hypothetical protein